MAEVTINNAKVTLTTEQILSAIEQLSPEEREKIRRRLSREGWRQDMEQLLDGIRGRLDEHPVTEEQIDREVSAVRAARRARCTTHGGHGHQCVRERLAGRWHDVGASGRLAGPAV